MNSTTDLKVEKVCTLEDCTGRVVACGYCDKHYRKWRKYGNPRVVKVEQNHNRLSLCAVDGCESKHHAKGFCEKHLKRFKRNGDALKTRKTPNGTYTVCTLPGCGEKHFGKGLCEKHWRQKRYAADSKLREQALNYSRKRKALRRAAPINDLTIKDWESSLSNFNNECAYCGKTERSLQQEHIKPISRNGSNTKTNVVPACVSCNQNKKAKPFELWYPAQPFYNREREDRILKWMGHKVENNNIQMKLF